MSEVGIEPAVIDAVGVVVPAHDEAARLPTCLAALAAALERLPTHMPRLVVLVLDACRDASPAIAQRWAAAHPDRRIVTLEARNVGQARAAGMQCVLDQLADVPPARTWLATSDADSTVPARWLVDQLALAARGAQAIAGAIHVADWRGYPAGFDARFAQHYAPPGSADHHPHVHGANLGVRGDAYLAAGGFAPVPSGEDHALWRALQRTGRPCVATRAIDVVTSARRGGRAPGGFAKFLRDLERR